MIHTTHYIQIAMQMVFNKQDWRRLQSGWRRVLVNKKQLKWVVLDGGEQSTVFRLINAHIANLILKFQGLALNGRWPLTVGGAYFKVRGIIHKKFQNFVVFSFQIALNEYHYDVI